MLEKYETPWQLQLPEGFVWGGYLYDNGSFTFWQPPNGTTLDHFLIVPPLNFYRNRGVSNEPYNCR